MTWFSSIADKAYQYLGEGGWKPRISVGETKESFEVEYMEMRSRFKAKMEILPVLLADVCVFLFSDKMEERNFMVRTWCMLDAYSRQPSTSSSTNYPYGYTARNGPVPIQRASVSRPYSPTGPANALPETRAGYRWTDDQYRWVILALRAISAPPQYHIEGNKKNAHAESDCEHSKTCLDLFPTMFDGQTRWTQSGGGWDKNEFGCIWCDAHIMVFTYIALAENRRLHTSGLSISTVVPSKIPELIRDLEQRRYKYEDFWQLISQQHSQKDGCADNGNAWAMKKLARLDWEKRSSRRLHWNYLKLKAIQEQIASFKNENVQVALQAHVGNVAHNGHPAPKTTNGTTSARLEIDLSDSDDELSQYCKHLASPPSTGIRQRTLATAAVRKTGLVLLDSLDEFVEKRKSGSFEVEPIESDDDKLDLYHDYRASRSSNSAPKKRGYERDYVDAGRKSKKTKDGAGSSRA